MKNQMRRIGRPSTRKLIQLYSALLHNAHLKGFIEGEIYQGKAKYACVPGLNCYSCPGAAAACPLGALQNALAATGHRAGWYVFGILMLFGVIAGRTICGWLCPMGLIQELLHKIPSFKIKKNRFTRGLTYLKYVLLAVFVCFIPLWYGLKQDIPMPAFCKYICPAGTLEGSVGLLANPGNSDMLSMLGIFFTRKFVILLLLGLACIFCYRSFCRFMCPLGAIYGLFNRYCLIGVKVDTERCNGCGACVRHCSMDVKHVGDHECIQCAGCMDVCHQDAISLKAGKITLRAPERIVPDGKNGAVGELPAAEKREQEKTGKQRRIAWGIALAVLCFALLWFNVLDPAVRRSSDSADTVTAVSAVQDESEEMVGTTSAASGAEKESTETISAESAVSSFSDENTEMSDTVSVVSTSENTAQDGETTAGEQSYESDAPVGFEVGMRLEDFTLSCLDGSAFHLADTRGKVTFINLWATYCTPCVKELPYFDALYKEHEGDIAMLAVHSSIMTDDPAEYVEKNGWGFPFAIDTADDMLWKIVDGSTTLPQTIVLNRRGEVIYNQKGSVTPEMLDALYEQAAQPANK